MTHQPSSASYRLGAALRSLRLTAGLTQGALAAQAQIHAASIGGCERGRPIRRGGLVKALRALDVDDDGVQAFLEAHSEGIRPATDPPLPERPRAREELEAAARALGRRLLAQDLVHAGLTVDEAAWAVGMRCRDEVHVPPKLAAGTPTRPKEQR